RVPDHPLPPALLPLPWGRRGVPHGHRRRLPERRGAAGRRGLRMARRRGRRRRPLERRRPPGPGLPLARRRAAGPLADEPLGVASDAALAHHGGAARLPEGEPARLEVGGEGGAFGLRRLPRLVLRPAIEFGGAETLRVALL